MRSRSAPASVFKDKESSKACDLGDIAKMEDLHRNVGEYELYDVATPYDVGIIVAKIRISIVAVAKCVCGPA